MNLSSKLGCSVMGSLSRKLLEQQWGVGHQGRTRVETGHSLTSSPRPSVAAYSKSSRTTPTTNGFIGDEPKKMSMYGTMYGTICGAT